MSIITSVNWKEQVSSRYEIFERLGISDHSIVFRGRDLVGSREVALKIVPNATGNDHRGGMREVSLLQSLTHENLVECLDVLYLRDGGFVIVYEYVNGGDFRGYLDNCSDVSIDEWCQCALQIFSALEYLQANGVIHCDLKPENILLMKDHAGQVITYKVSDFGVARFYDASQLVMTQGTGSPAYMAPEAFSGRPTFASDIYSAGIILYELAIGHRPFTGSVRSLARAHSHELPDFSEIKWHGAKVILSLLLQKKTSHRLCDTRTLTKLFKSLAESQGDGSINIEPQSQPQDVLTRFPFLGTTAGPEQSYELEDYRFVQEIELVSPFDCFEPVSLGGQTLVLAGNHSCLQLLDAARLADRGVFYYTNGRPIQILSNQGFVTSSASQIELWNTDSFSPEAVESLGLRVGVSRLDGATGRIAWTESSKVFSKEIGSDSVTEYSIPSAKTANVQYLAFWNGHTVTIQGLLNPLLTALNDDGFVIHQVALPGPIIQISCYETLEFLCWDNRNDHPGGATVISVGADFRIVATNLNSRNFAFNRFSPAGAILTDENGQVFLRGRQGSIRGIGYVDHAVDRRIVFSVDAKYYYVYSESAKDNLVQVYSKESDV